MAAKRKTKGGKGKKKKPLPPQPRKRPTPTLINKALREHAGHGNTRVGLKDTPYRQRRSFRNWDDDTVRIVWDWYATRDADGVQVFSQRQIADYLGMPYSAVSNICRCMPEGWGTAPGKKKR